MNFPIALLLLFFGISDAAIPLSPMLPDYMPRRFPHRHPLPLPLPQRGDTSGGTVRMVVPGTGPVEVEAGVQNSRHGDHSILRPIALNDEGAIPNTIPAPRPLNEESTNGTVISGNRLRNIPIDAGVLPVIRSPILLNNQAIWRTRRNIPLSQQLINDVTGGSVRMVVDRRPGGNVTVEAGVQNSNLARDTPFPPPMPLSQAIARTRRDISIPHPLKLKEDITEGRIRLVVPRDGGNVTVDSVVENHKQDGSPLLNLNTQPHGTIHQIPGYSGSQMSRIPVGPQQNQTSGGSVQMVVGPNEGPLAVVAEVKNSLNSQNSQIARAVRRFPRMIGPLHRNHMHPLSDKKPAKMNLMHFPWNQRPIKIVNIEATAQPTVAPAKHHEKKCKNVTVNGVTICA